MTVTVGDIIARLTLDIREFRANSDEAQKRLKQQASDFEEVGKAGTKAFALITAAIGVAEVSYAKFEQAAKNVQAVSGATSAQMAQLGDSAKVAALKWGDFSDAVMDGAGEAIKAGAAFKDLQAGGVEAIVTLSQAGDITKAQAGEIMSTIKNTYGEAAGSYTRIADLLANASNGAAGNMNDMVMALKQVESVSHGVGQSLEDLLTAVGTLENGGLIGEQAGTSYATLLQALIPKTKEAETIFKQFGLTVNGQNIFFDQASGKLKGIADIAQILHDKFDGLNAQARLDVFGRLFGTDAIKAASGLADGTERIRQFQAQLNDTTAATVAAAKMDTLQGSVKRMQSQFSLATQEIGAQFAPVVKEFVAGLGSLAEKYNGLAPETRTMVTANVTATTTAIGLASAFSLVAAVVVKLRAETGLLVTAFNILRANPLILVFSALAGAVAAYSMGMAQAAEEAKKFKAAQDELNDALRKSPIARSVDDVKNLQDRQKNLQDLAKQHADLLRQIDEAEQRVNDLPKQAAKGVPATAKDIASATKAVADLHNALTENEQAMKDAGVTVDTVNKAIGQLGDQIKASVPAMRQLTEADIQNAVTKKEGAVLLDELASKYNALASQQNLSAEQTSELRDVTQQLHDKIPSLIVVEDAHGRAIIKNTDLLTQRIKTENDAAEASRKAAESEVQDRIKETQAAIDAAEAQIKAYETLQKARAAFLSQESSGIDPSIDQEKSGRRLLSMAEDATKKAGDAAAVLPVLRSELGKYQDDLAKLSGDAFKTIGNGVTSGGASWSMPDTSKNSGPSADSLAKQADEATQERYQAELDAAKHAMDAGLISRSEYILKLKGLETEFSQWLSKHYQERYQLEDEIGRQNFENSSDWIAQKKAEMESEGKTTQEVANFEIGAWQRVADNEANLAEDRKKAVQEVQRAKHDAAAASFQSSVDWISREEQAMKDAGATEVEIAQMRMQAWQRVHDRNIYNIEDEKRATEELANAQRDLVSTIENELAQARQRDAEIAIKQAEDEAGAAESALQAQIDALDQQAETERQLLDIEEQRQKIADLQAQRDAVAADKRFELIERDSNGNLVRTLTADTAKLADLGKQIADEKKNLEQKLADQERAYKKSVLEKELTDLKASNQRKLDALHAYWDEMQKQERINQDVIYAISKNGLNKTTAMVDSYLSAIEAKYEAMQTKLMSLGGMALPGVGTIESSTSDKSAIVAQMNANSAAWGSASDADKQRLHDENTKLAQSIGAKWDNASSTWKFHGGVDSVPGASGTDVPSTLQAGERVISAPQNVLLSRFLEGVANYRPQTQAIAAAVLAATAPIVPRSAQQAMVSAAGGGGGVNIPLSVTVTGVDQKTREQIAREAGQKAEHAVYHGLEGEVWNMATKR